MDAKYFLYPALALLVGCGADEPTKTSELISVSEQTEETGGVIPEHQLRALEKAKGVEAELQDSLKRREEAATEP